MPEILGKALDRGMRAVVVAGSTERVEQLNGHLWTYDPASFLPHGSARDGNAPEQPIWLTARDENPNGADLLILTDGAASDRVADFALCCELFDGNDPDAVQAARGRWKAYKEAGHAVTYWKQGERGGWEKAG